MVHLPASGVLFTGDVLMPYLGQPFAAEGSPEGLLAGPRLHRQPAAPPAHPRPHHADRAVHRRGGPRPAGGPDPAARPGAGRHPRRPHPPGHPGGGQPPGRAPRAPHGGRALPGDPRPLHRAALPPAHRLLAARPARTRAGHRGRARRRTRPARRGREEPFAAAAATLIGQGDHALALQIIQPGLLRHPASSTLAGLRATALHRLMEQYQQIDPFKFLIYAELAGAEIGPVQ